MNYQNEISRNHDKKSIIKFIKYIKNKKKNKSKKILLICDRKNLLNLKKIFKNEKKIFFSKHYTQSFLEDGYYILNSDFYYQYHGSGISVFAEFSKIKFEIYTDLKRGFSQKILLGLINYTINLKKIVGNLIIKNSEILIIALLE